MKTKKITTKIEIQKKNIRDWARNEEGVSGFISRNEKTTWKPTPSLANVLWAIKAKVESLRYNTKGMNKKAEYLTYDLYELVKCYNAYTHFEGLED